MKIRRDVYLSTRYVFIAWCFVKNWDQFTFTFICEDDGGVNTYVCLKEDRKWNFYGVRSTVAANWRLVPPSSLPGLSHFMALICEWVVSYLTRLYLHQQLPQMGFRISMIGELGWDGMGQERKRGVE